MCFIITFTAYFTNDIVAGLCSRTFFITIVHTEEEKVLQPLELHNLVIFHIYMLQMNVYRLRLDLWNVIKMMDNIKGGIIMKVIMYFVRHGQTRLNEKGRMGVCDSPLTTQGELQVEKTRVALNNVFLMHYILLQAADVSKLLRIILEGRNLEPVIINNLHRNEFLVHLKVQHITL